MFGAKSTDKLVRAAAGPALGATGNDVGAGRTIGCCIVSDSAFRRVGRAVWNNDGAVNAIDWGFHGRFLSFFISNFVSLL